MGMTVNREEESSVSKSNQGWDQETSWRTQCHDRRVGEDDQAEECRTPPRVGQRRRFSHFLECDLRSRSDGRRDVLERRRHMFCNVKRQDRNYRESVQMVPDSVFESDGVVRF